MATSKIKAGILFSLCVFCCRLCAQTKNGSSEINIREEIKYVRLIDWSRFNSKLPGNPRRSLMEKILLNTNKYAVTAWWEKRGFAGVPAAEYLDLKGVSEHKIRPVAAEAEALAVSLRTGLYDLYYTGVAARVAEAKVIQLIRSLAHTHLANKTNGWGNVWQSPLWAGYTAFAAWAMWDKLDSLTRREVLAMVNDECDWVMHNKGMPDIKTYRDRAGNIISPGDTGAEENAWDAAVLGVACAMMPELPQRAAWMHQLIKLSLNAMARPADVQSRTMYNGKRLGSWLAGSNINENGTVVNHHFIHPDYMTSPFELNSTKYFLLAGLPVPQAFRLNTDVIFHAFADLKFNIGDSLTGGRVKSRGGTIFKKGSGDIFYPLGTDWGTARRMNFSLFNGMAAVLTSDPKIRKRALDWELEQGQVVLNMQSRFSDGHTYLNASEDRYPSCEEWVADGAMTTYIIELSGAIDKPVFTNDKY